MKKYSLSLVILFLCVASQLSAQTDWQWGGVNQEWTDAGNWTNGVPVPSQNVVINDATNFPIISTAVDRSGTGNLDTWVGQGTSGRLDITSGGSMSTSGSWLFIGQNNSADGELNLVGGTLTSDNDVRVGRDGTANGRLYVNSGATVAVREIFVGDNGGTGDLHVDNSGGSFTTTGTVGIQNSLAVNEIVSGDLNIGGEFWVANAAGGNATLDMTGGSLNVQSWVAIGRDGSTGVVNLSDGTFQSSLGFDDRFTTIGTNGGTGTVNQTGGVFNNAGDMMLAENGTGFYNQDAGEMNTGFLWVGNNDNDADDAGVGEGTYTLNGGTATVTDGVILGRNGGTIGTFNLNGGTLVTAGITQGGGAGILNLDGGTLRATVENENFVGGVQVNLLSVTTINSDGVDVAVTSDLSGAGGITKAGENTLSLTGFNSFTGVNTVQEGQLVLRADASGTGVVSVLNEAALGVNVLTAGDVLSVGGLVLGQTSGDEMDLNLNIGNANGTNPEDPLIFNNGALNISGTTTVNVAGAGFVVAELPLIGYDNTQRSGAGSFVLGTVPSGVVATIVDDPDYFGADQGLVYLDITAVAQPRWNGDVDQDWQTALNWQDPFSLAAVTFMDGDPVLFDDNAMDPNVVVSGTVAPSDVNFANEFTPYTLGGSGAISGATGLTKGGASSLNISSTMTSDFTGPVRIEGGNVSVDAIPDAGTAGPLGAGNRVVIAGGALDYTGGAVATTRSLEVDGTGGALNSDSDLTLSGSVIGTSGDWTKNGFGALILANASNSLASIRVNGGSLTTGSVAGQVSTATGFFLGSGVTATMNADSMLTVNGDTNIADAVGATSVLNLNDTAEFVAAARVNIGLNGADGALNLNGNSVFNHTVGWFSIGTNGGGNGVLTVRENAVLNTVGDFNLSDVDPSTGTLNLQENGAINSTGTTFFAKNPNTSAFANISGGTLTTSANFFLANNATSTATVTQTGGAVVANGDDNQIGANGFAQWDISGGTMLVNGWFTLGRFAGGTGTMNASGGVVTQNHPTRPLRVGEEGTGTLNISGTAQVNATSTDGVLLGGPAGSQGTITLLGGTLTTTRIVAGGADGVSNLIFDGGTLQAAVGANADFIGNTLDLLDVDGSGVIDTNGQSVTIAQMISGGGDLAVSGGGTLVLSGENTHSGTLTVGNGTTVSTTLSTVFSDDATVNVATGGTLNLNFTGNDIVTEFEIDGVPQGPGVYTAATNPTEISGGGALEVPSGLTPYAAWIDSFYPGETDPLIVGPDADPDKDGFTNQVEFALGGEPDKGGSTPGIYVFAQDSDADGDADAELLMTIAVRAGAAFSAGPNPEATQDGVVYLIQGSLDLVDFDSDVSPVTTAVTTDLPVAPAGYEYRTFSLDESNGVPSEGFLRVALSPEM